MDHSDATATPVWRASENIKRHVLAARSSVADQAESRNGVLHCHPRQHAAWNLPTEIVFKIVDHMLDEDEPLDLTTVLPRRSNEVAPSQRFRFAPVPARVFAPLAVSHGLRDHALKSILESPCWFVDSSSRLDSMPNLGQWGLPAPGAVLTVRWTIARPTEATMAEATQAARRKPVPGWSNRERGDYMLWWFKKTELKESRKQWSVVAEHLRLLMGLRWGEVIMDGRGLERMDAPGLERVVWRELVLSGLLAHLRREPWASHTRAIAYPGMNPACLLPW